MFGSRSVLSSLMVSSALVLCCLYSTRSTVFAQTAKPVLVKGRVLDQNRDAVPGAQLTLELTDGQSPVSTNERGEFSVLTPVGEIRLMVMAEGFATRLRTIKVKADDNPLEIVLEVADASAIVTVIDGSGYLTEAVRGAMKTSTPLRDIPQSISVVSSELIKDQSMQSMADVIAYVPGITSHQGENNRDQLIFRGNSSSADFFVNGVRDDVQYYRDLY